MNAASGRKKRILCVYKILFEFTDDNHYLKVPQIISRLADNYGIYAERKSIYDDIAVLNSMGADINHTGGRDGGYCMLTRRFELYHLKLLVDTVQSSKFITEAKSRELISKLSSLTSKYQADQLRRHVYIASRVKSENKSVFNNVDLINRAINENKKVCFKYFYFNEKKEKVFRHGGKVYEVSPRELAIDDGNYYMIAYDSEEKTFKHFRVDKMIGAETADTCCDKSEMSQISDLGLYTKRLFGMFGNDKEQLVRIRFPNDLAGVLIDRFGMDISMHPDGSKHFTAAIKVCVSPQFYGWIFGLSAEAEIIAPKEIANEYKKRLEAAYIKLTEHGDF